MFILEVTKTWINREKGEKRLIHHAGGGAFIADGETIDMRRFMTKWRYLMD